jgi:predicted nucleotidyltransferase component of viral defense system
VADPDYTLDQVALVASPPDLLATKLKVLLQRAERKDYLDVATLLNSGLALSDGLAAAQAGRKLNVIFIALRFMNFVALKLAAVTLSTRAQMESLQLFLVKGVSTYF